MEKLRGKIRNHWRQKESSQLYARVLAFNGSRCKDFYDLKGIINAIYSCLQITFEAFSLYNITENQISMAHIYFFLLCKYGSPDDITGFREEESQYVFKYMKVALHLAKSHYHGDKVCWYNASYLYCIAPFWFLGLKTWFLSDFQNTIWEDARHLSYFFIIKMVPEFDHLMSCFQFFLKKMTLWSMVWYIFSLKDLWRFLKLCSLSL